MNSKPPIYLTKIGLGNILEALKIEKLTSPEVRKEVINKGKGKGVPDVFILERMFEIHALQVVEPKDQKLLLRLLEIRGLHLTDAQILVIAKERGGIAIVDDASARKTAKIYGIPHAGTPYILMKAVLQKLITKERAKRAIDEMISAGWRSHVEAYAEIMRNIEKL